MGLAPWRGSLRCIFASDILFIVVPMKASNAIMADPQWPASDPTGVDPVLDGQSPKIPLETFNTEVRLMLEVTSLCLLIYTGTDDNFSLSAKGSTVRLGAYSMIQKYPSLNHDNRVVTIVE